MARAAPEKAEDAGYSGRALELIQKAGAAIGDTIRVTDGISHEGILMPLYEGGGDTVVIKMASGYNVGISAGGIEGVERLGGPQEQGAARPDPPAGDPSLPRLLLLSTGGTIASRVDYRTGAVTPVLTAEDLNESAPELAGIANIEARELFAEYSENIVPEQWVQIAEAVMEAAPKYDGIMIAHGTDTMHYTSAYLSFALAGIGKPVALVGSQRSPDRASSDAPHNLVGAARFLAGCGVPGVYVVMHNDESDGTIACHAGTRVRKNHTSRRGAFETVGGDPAFLVVDGKVSKNIKSYFAEGAKPSIKLDRRAALVKYYPGLGPGIMDAHVSAGCKAIILEGTGLGHVGKEMYPAVKAAVEKGVFVGMVSQCIDGRTSMTVYESGRDLLAMGVVPLEGMVPEAALAKAMWAAGMEDRRDGIERIMLGQVASEFG